MVGRVSCPAPGAASEIERRGWATMPRSRHWLHDKRRHAYAYGLLAGAVQAHCDGGLSAESLLRLLDTIDTELNRRANGGER
ncbi:hypothetical protein [Amycolatopsis aidingensis]|uniref:hypothetical protein n=1 Tax=Amycolatopsis aidingensis TaxID=2842453 RepID=UPI001C0D766A|nr:hypothetical protein [Amycolatopsis aidingensis]